MSSYTYAFSDSAINSSVNNYDNPYDAFQTRPNNDSKLYLIKNDNDKKIQKDIQILNILDTKIILIKWAVACAEHVLNIFEEKYPDDKRPRKSIEAAINWIKDPSEQNREICKDSAAAAASAPYTNADAACRAANAASYASCAVSSAPINTYFSVSNASYSSSKASNNESSEIIWQRQKLQEIINEYIPKEINETKVSFNETKVSFNETKVSFNETKVSFNKPLNDIEQEIKKRRELLEERRNILEQKKQKKYQYKLELLKIEEDELAMAEAEWDHIEKEL